MYLNILDLLTSYAVVLNGLELLHLAFTMVFMVVFIVMASFMLYMMYRALRTQRPYHPPSFPSARELLKELMCPKCGSKELEPIGHYAIRCKSCNFIFSIGPSPTYAYYPGWWWFWPIIWPIFWIWPIVLTKEK